MAPTFKLLVVAEADVFHPVIVNPLLVILGAVTVHDEDPLYL